MKRFAFSALMLLVGWQRGQQACKKVGWGAGVLICLDKGADLRMAQLMPLTLTVSCFRKVVRFTFPVPDHWGSPAPGQRARKRVCVAGM